ncbi:dethiobiotin synthase [Sphingomonas asaccharolytica]|uniref:dethiobiotin synthase n=1 Tax=Sphingomonas asaccharolytica TaxID=40681 RepID=UPI0012ED0DC5|nr:dethiobiotin synthase [Sphingomonas asaccharolytica]
MVTAIVVTATGTDIGKTVFAAALTAALDGCYWKPVQAGLDDGSDLERVGRLSALPAERLLPEAYRLTTPCSPHRAAEIDGVTIDIDALEPPPRDRPLVIEGAGGVLVPFTRRATFADVMARWQLPVVLVAATSLGTISHSLTAIEALRTRKVDIRGIAFVGDAVEDSEATIAAMGGVKRLGRLPMLESLDPGALAAAFAANFNLADFR